MGVVGCGKTEQADDTWIVGTSPDYPPFEFVDEDGEFAGFDMDLIREVGKRLGVEVKIEALEFDSLIASLKQGKIDAIIACMTADEERLKEVDFTKPYYTNQTGVLVNPDAEVDIATLDDVLKYELGVQTGTTMASWAKNQVDEGIIEESQVNYYSDADAGVDDVKIGRLDVFLLDAPVAHEKAKKLGLEVVLETTLDQEEGEQPGIVLKKGSTEMVDKLNNIIDEMNEDGTIEELEKKWFD